jgi:hypothetical protein
VYEGDRLVGAEVTREPEWSTRDLEMVEVQDAWERSLDENGVPFDEATDPNIRWRAGVPVVEPDTGKTLYASRINYVTKAKLDAMDALRKEHPDENLNGRFFTVEKVESSERK